MDVLLPCSAWNLTTIALLVWMSQTNEITEVFS